jgi:hypothetical protein
MDFKFFKSNESTGTFNLMDYETPAILTFNPPSFQNDVEFCFQFDDDEPITYSNKSNTKW